MAGRPPVDVCLFPAAGDEVTPWLLEHAWIDEPVQRAFLDHVGPGMRVLDLGSHLGLFSLTAASLGAEVLAFDAVPLHVRQLRMAAKHNGFDRLRVVHGVIAAAPGTREFVASSIHSHAHNEQTARHEDFRDRSATIEVEAARVDDAVAAAGWDAVDVVKMDIEGTELDALDSMKGLFAAGARPVVVFESNGFMLPLFGASTQRLRRWFTKRGYRLWFVDHVRPGTLVDARELRVQPEAVSDFLALPDDRAPAGDWQLVAPLTREETVTRLLDQAVTDEWAFRNYVGCALAEAPAWVRADPLVGPARNALAEDLDGTVRSNTPQAGVRHGKPAAAEPPDPTLAVLARGVDVAERPEILARAAGQAWSFEPPLLLRELSFHVRRGTMVGLLGPHPHERSVLMSALAGRHPIANGTLDVRGRTLALARLAQGLEADLTVRENVAIFAAFLGQDATVAGAEATAERAGLADHLDDPLGDQAADQILRLALTLTLQEPRRDLLLLHAVPRSLDGGFADWAWERIAALCRSGVTIVQSAADTSTLLGAPDRLLYLTGRTIRAAGHPGSVDDLMRRHTLGLADREVRLGP
ncbi:MAG: hypothetical protein QOF76_1910 [Solirubrobacteraceae bacterium]|nr:hypothetical protein [Solirubrobacteraceae bacterium]